MVTHDCQPWKTPNSSNTCVHSGKKFATNFVTEAILTTDVPCQVTSQSGTTTDYCDQRKICNASIIWKDGTWTYGKGTWEKNGEHTHHEPDNERCAAEIARGTAKLMAKTDPYVTASQIMEKVVSNGLPQPYPNDNAIKQSLLRVRKSAARVTGDETLPQTRSSSERETFGDDHDDDDREEILILDSDDSSGDSKPKLKRKVKAEPSTPTS